MQEHLSTDCGDMVTPILDAIEIIGGPSKVAAGLRDRGFPRMSPSHVRNWVKRDKKVPAEIARHLEAMVAATGRGEIPRHRFRPDVFGIPESSNSQPPETASVG